MSAEFLVAAGQIFGATLSVVVVLGAFRVGGTYKGVIRDVAETKDSCREIRLTLDAHGPRIQTIEHTLHGPQGENGMYGAVRDLVESVRQIKEQRIGPPDRRKAARPGKQRRKSA